MPNRESQLFVSPTSGKVGLVFSLIFSFAISSVFALQLFDDFSAGSLTWTSGPGWSVINPTPNLYFYRCDSSGDSLAWKKLAPFGSSWQFQADVKFRTLYGNNGDTGVGSLALSKDGINSSVKFLVDFTHHSSGSLLIQAAYFDGVWHGVLDTGWLSGSAPEYQVRLERVVGNNSLRISVQATNGFNYTVWTAPVPEDLIAGVNVPGLRVNSAVVDIGNVQFVSPDAASPQKNYRMLATNAVNDLLDHFWSGNDQTGQIVNTWGGYTNAPLPDPRGGLWERATLYLVLDNLSRLPGYTNIQQLRMQSDWNRTKSVYTANELESCGQASGINWAVDDAGWSALMYLAAYRATGDQYALDRAKGLVNCAFSRWLDNQLGGGMWYRDAKDYKSLYQVAIVLAALRIYEVTGDQTFFDRAMSCYSWMENHLLRADGLYWVDYGPSGPIGQERPDDINEAGSVVFLGGNMAMGVLHARLFRMTSTDMYRARAVRTADALSNRMRSLSGLFVNDRDAWVEGTFAGDWAREVLTLSGITARHWTVLRSTADSIYTNARTSEGYYGGSWSGPADGAVSRWWAIGSKPQQITTSSSSVNMIVAAAYFDSHLLEMLKPSLQTARRTTDGKIQITATGEPGWSHQFQSSTNLTTWTTLTNYFTDSISNLFKFTPLNFGTGEFYRSTLLVDP